MEKHPKIIYISSPYSLGDKMENVLVQIKAAHRIMDLGHCPIAPLLSHFLHLYRPRPYNDWLDVDLELVARMDIILRLPGISDGADKEVQEARFGDIPVVFGWEDLYDLLEIPEDRRNFDEVGGNSNIFKSLC